MLEKEKPYLGPGAMQNIRQLGTKLQIQGGKRWKSVNDSCFSCGQSGHFKRNCPQRVSDGRLFVARLPKETCSENLENMFKWYGPVTRCVVKRGVSMAYAFVDFEDIHDAVDALNDANGREVLSSRIIVQWAKGRSDKGYRCRRSGHQIRDCPETRGGRFRRETTGTEYQDYEESAERIVAKRAC